MLNVGEPVKSSTWRAIIRLSGLRLDTDIRIEFTGVRPGEKLCEKLSHIEEGTVPTHQTKGRAFAANAEGRTPGYDERGLSPPVSGLRCYRTPRRRPAR